MSLNNFLIKHVYSEGVTPLPVVITAVVCGLVLMNSMAVTMVFSFLPKLVKSFGTSEVDTGYYAGFIASGMFIGVIMTSFLWGYLADKKGKKPAAILCATGLMLTTLAFSFSFNFYWALTTRFLQGCFMGLVPITKSIMVEVCDDTNVGIGISMVMSAYVFGVILGPCIGGFLAFPAKKYPQAFSQDSLFEHFGILLPELILVIGLAVVTVCTFVYLPPNKIRKKGEEAYLISTKGHDKNFGPLFNTDKDDYLNYSIETESNSKLNNTSMNSFLIVETVGITTDENCCNMFTKNGLQTSKIGKLLRTKECILSCILYSTYSLVSIGYEEMLPLYAATQTDLHGLGFSVANIGTVLLIVTCAMFVLQILFIQKIARRLGARKSFIYGGLIQALFIPLIPTVQQITNRTMMWVALCFILMIAHACMLNSILCINLLLNNSATPDLLGSANGLGATFASVGRAIGPTALGSIYAWSLSNVKENKHKYTLGFPFNQYLAFLVISFIGILNSLFVTQFNKSMDSKKIREEEETDDLKKITYMTFSNFKPGLSG